MPVQPPAWIAIAGFVLGVINLIVIAVPILVWMLRDTRVIFHLTSEIFFRLSESGECFFANASIVSEGAPALIKKVDLKLLKMDNPSKSYQVTVQLFGVKKYTSGPHAENHFDSKSPYLYLPQDVVHRPVWLCAIDHSRIQIETAVRSHDLELINVVAGFQASPPADPRDLVSQMYEKVATPLLSISNLLALEPGKYRLSATLSYEPRGGVLRSKSMRTSVSSIEFTVDETVIANIKGNTANPTSAV